MLFTMKVHFSLWRTAIRELWIFLLCGGFWKIIKLLHIMNMDIKVRIGSVLIWWMFHGCKLLSLMTITRVRLTYHSGRETGGRGDACISGGPHHGVWDLYWKYAGRGGLIFRQGQIASVFFWDMCYNLL